MKKMLAVCLCILIGLTPLAAGADSQKWRINILPVSDELASRSAVQTMQISTVGGLDA